VEAEVPYISRSLLGACGYIVLGPWKRIKSKRDILPHGPSSILALCDG